MYVLVSAPYFFHFIHLFIPYPGFHPNPKIGIAWPIVGMQKNVLNTFSEKIETQKVKNVQQGQPAKFPLKAI